MTEETKEYIKPYDKLIRATSISTEQPIFMIATNRWAYALKYMNDWQDAISFEVYWKALAVVGVILLLMGNFLSILALAGAAYYRIQFEHRTGQVNSKRRLILGN